MEGVTPKCGTREKVLLSGNSRHQGPEKNRPSARPRPQRAHQLERLGRQTGNHERIMATEQCTKECALTALSSQGRALSSRRAS